MATLRLPMRTLLRAFCTCLIAALAAAPGGALAKPRRGPCLPDAAHSPTCSIWNAKVTLVADGDTLGVRIDGSSRSRRVRLTGFNSTELTRYSHKASRRRGECHAVEAAGELERLVNASHGRVRLAAQHPSSHSGSRLRRSVQVRIGGRWRDVGPIMLRDGMGLWLPNGRERAWNHSYSRIAQEAAARGRGLYDTSFCGAGPEAGANLRVRVNWDADGNDHRNVNGEFIEVRNLDPTRAVHIGGWWVRDSDLRRHVLPSWATVPAGGQVRVHVGRGHEQGTDFFWGFSHPLFDVTGDGGYLFDPQGDLRAWMIYPCSFRCTDPLEGRVRVAAQPAGRDEYATVRNVSASPIDLAGYVLALPFHNYEFGQDSAVGPGEAVRVEVGGSRSGDTRLVKHFGFSGSMLADGGGRVRLQSDRDIVVGCAAWGDAGC